MMILPRIAAWLWALGFFLSLDFGVFPAPEIERLAAVLCVLAGAALVSLSGGAPAKHILQAPAISAAILGLWVLVMISALWSVSPGISLLYGGAFSVMPATVLALLFAMNSVRETFFRHALYAGSIVISGLCLWALAQVFVLPEYLVTGQVRHPFANPNAFAGLLTLCLLITLGLYFQAENARLRLALITVMVLTGAALAAIASQAATLTLTGGLMLILALTMRHAGFEKIAALLPALALVLLIGVIMAMQPGKTDIVSRLSALASGHTGTWDNRIDIWMATWELITTYPLLGTGYKTFHLMYPSVRLPSETFSGGFMAHSDPLQFWAELGIAGVVLFYTIGTLVLLRFFRWFQYGGRNPLTIALFAACAAFVVHSHVDFLLYTMPTMLAFALALAALIMRTERPGEAMVTPFSFANRFPAPFQAGLVLLPVAMILFFFVPLMVSDYFSARASKLVFADVEGFATAVNAADRTGMGLNPRPYAMAVTVPLGILKARSPAIPPEEQRQLFYQTEDLIRAGLRQNSRNAAMHFYRSELTRLVLPSILPGGYPTEEESLEAALAINPLHIPSRLALAGLMQERGNAEQALDLLVAGLGWPYTSFNPEEYFSKTIALANALAKPELAAQAEKSRKIHNLRLKRFMRRNSAVQALREEVPFLP